MRRIRGAAHHAVSTNANAIVADMPTHLRHALGRDERHRERAPRRAGPVDDDPRRHQGGHGPRSGGRLPAHARRRSSGRRSAIDRGRDRQHEDTRSRAPRRSPRRSAEAPGGSRGEAPRRGGRTRRTRRGSAGCQGTPSARSRSSAPDWRDEDERETTPRTSTVPPSDARARRRRSGREQPASVGRAPWRSAGSSTAHSATAVARDAERGDRERGRATRRSSLGSPSVREAPEHEHRPEHERAAELRASHHDHQCTRRREQNRAGRRDGDARHGVESHEPERRGAPRPARPASHHATAKSISSGSDVPDESAATASRCSTADARPIARRRGDERNIGMRQRRRERRPTPAQSDRAATGYP